MSTPAEHYAEAERLLAGCAAITNDDTKALVIAQAAVHARLALVPEPNGNGVLTVPDV